MRYSEKTVRACAEHAHEINRVYCFALGDASQPPWALAAPWQRESAEAGVRAILSGSGQTPEKLHELWLQDKFRNGWVYGPTKDPLAKTHPCMVPYAELPVEQRAKDYLFRASVIGMAKALESGA